MDYTIITPSYHFNTDIFRKKIQFTKQRLGEISLTYSVKANAFLLSALPDEISYVEVCSPGELQICKKAGIPGNRIIYSGVNKEKNDLIDAISYGTDIVTAESLKQLALEQEVAKNLGVQQKVLLRLSSGNQFGMSQEDMYTAITGAFSDLIIWGIHYYSGTQKKSKLILKDIERLTNYLDDLKSNTGYIPRLVEYGPGVHVDYFGEKSREPLSEIKEAVLKMNEYYPVGIEMGRYFAAECGMYMTRVMDIKNTDGVNYVILDGGVHHLKYYGQMMAMQIPEIVVIDALSDKEDYCLCGSLCTVADVLVRNVKLPRLKEGSLIMFKNCGAYAVTEGSSLFLSRDLPAVYLTNDSGIRLQKRLLTETYDMNC